MHKFLLVITWSDQLVIYGRIYKLLVTSLKCAVPENIHTHSKEGHLKRKYEAKLEFPEGWGVSNQKKLPWWKYGYFLEQHNIQSLLISLWISIGYFECEF